MKYRAGERRKAVEYEKDLVDWWKKHRVFERSVEERPLDNSYVFYDGPPFITGQPHHGTLLSSVVKDAMPRYWTMRGKRVERRWGWDCHGLPAENYVEKQLGITDRREIALDRETGASARQEAARTSEGAVKKISLEDYILKAKESMVVNSESWRATIDRVGRWVDFDHAYRTMDKDFMESVWWAFRELYAAGKIYEGRKVLMYDTKFATPVSKAEVTMDNDAYREVTDPSAYVKFGLVGANALMTAEERKGRALYFLAWTTTPWTLPANMCLAVNPKLEYGIYEDGEELLILALERAKKLFPEQNPLVTLAGGDLVGLSYQPIIEVPRELADGDGEQPVENSVHKVVEKSVEGEAVSRGGWKKNTYTVLGADFVSAEDGTGIVHIAPAYGEDDYELAMKSEVDFVDLLDENGYYLPAMREKLNQLGVRDTDENGIQIWAANKFIAKVLEERGVVWRIDYIKHEYPFNPRSKERIIYRAFPSWFFDVQGQKSLMLAENENIHWFPAHLKHGRFAKNIEQAPDWNLSRDRFFATAMPVWKGEKTGAVKVFGSYDELAEYSGVRLEDYHRPWVDRIEFEAVVDEKTGDVMALSQSASKEGDSGGAARTSAERVDHFRRVDKVLDCWFESGSMPFAQLHYPFENKEKFERNYPADFIVEYVGQVRAWFYYVHVVNTALASIGAFGKTVEGELNAFKNVITTGTLAGNDGRKMSKSLGNYTDPNILMDQYSADSLRFLLLSSPVLAGEDFALIDKDVSDVNRRLAMLWNVYDFFATYAEIEGVDSEDLQKAAVAMEKGEEVLKNSLDRWIVARVGELSAAIQKGMEAYNFPKALSEVLPLLDDLSNWYVRRSRRRFSAKNEDAADRRSAFVTLYFVLTRLAVVLAPFVPFLAEELWQKMTGSGESVHLERWPELTKGRESDAKILAEMAQTREIITQALALRMQKSESEAQIKVRQPLMTLRYAGEKLPEFYEQIIADEVNVKRVEQGDELWLDKKLTDELQSEGRARELIRAIQNARKKAGLAMDDRIRLSLSRELPSGFEELVLAEVLADEFELDANYAYDDIAKIDGENVTISLEKI